MGAQPAFQRARGVLPVELEQPVRGRDQERGVAGQDRPMQQLFGEHGLAESLGGDQDDIFALRDEVEREDPVNGRPV